MGTAPRDRLLVSAGRQQATRQPGAHLAVDLQGAKSLRLENNGASRVQALHAILGDGCADGRQRWGSRRALGRRRLQALCPTLGEQGRAAGTPRQPAGPSRRLVAPAPPSLSGERMPANTFQLLMS